MSGHSHWATVKRGKEIEDKKRGKVFSKMSRIISIAAKEGGKDPETNAKLKSAIEKAREVNLPKDNIERAIKKGVGELDGERMELEEFAFEAFGPGGIAIIITGITDNKNRALGEVKQILNQNNGKLAGEGSVRWQFERKGTLIAEVIGNATDKDELEMAAIEAGADDIYWHENSLDIYTKPEDLDKVKKAMEAKGVKVNSSSLDWVAKEEISVDEKEKQSCEKLFEALDESDAVQDIYSNLKG